jgi:hypothetical protein
MFLLVSLLLACVESHADTLIERDISIKDRKAVRLEGKRGSLRISGWSQDRIRLRIDQKTTPVASKTDGLSVLETPLTVEIRLAHARGEDLLTRMQQKKELQTSADWEVKVPSGTDLDIVWGEGDVWLDDFKGSLQVRAERASVRIDHLKAKGESHFWVKEGAVEISDAECAARIWVSKGSVIIDQVRFTQPSYIEVGQGSVRVERVTGDLHLELNHASLRSEDFNGVLSVHSLIEPIEVLNLSGSLEAALGEGNVRVEWRDLKKDSWIESNGGKVAVTLPTSFAGRFDLTSLSGSTSVQFDVIDDPSIRSQYGPKAPGLVLGRVGAGSGPELRVRAKSDIRVLRP